MLGVGQHKPSKLKQNGVEVTTLFYRLYYTTINFLSGIVFSVTLYICFRYKELQFLRLFEAYQLLHCEIQLVDPTTIDSALVRGVNDRVWISPSTTIFLNFKQRVE